MNLIIGTLLYLWPNGRENTIQTGGQIMNATKRNIILMPLHLRLPRQSSWNKRLSSTSLNGWAGDIRGGKRVTYILPEDISGQLCGR